MNPTTLMLGAGKDLLDRLPEAERAVADREVGRDLKPTPLDVDEEFAPALRAYRPVPLSRRGREDAGATLGMEAASPADRVA